MTTTNKEEVKIEPNIGPRNFRHNPDVENFYRFVHDNQLRHEAKMLFKAILDKLKTKSKAQKKEKKITKH